MKSSLCVRLIRFGPNQSRCILFLSRGLRYFVRRIEELNNLGYSDSWEGLRIKETSLACPNDEELFDMCVFRKNYDEFALILISCFG